MPLLAFLTAIAYVPGIPSAAYAPRWWLLLIAAPMILLATKVRMTPAHWFGALFLTIATISGRWSVSELDTLFGVAQLAAMGAFFCIAAELKDTQAVWKAMAWGAAVNTAVALLQWLSPGIVESAGNFPAGLFFQKDFLGAYCAITVVALVWGIPNKSGWTAAAIGISAIGLLLSGSRGAALAGAFGLLLPAWLHLKRGRAIWLAGAVCVIGIIGFAAFIGDHGRQLPVALRLGQWSMILANLKLFGWGYGTLGAVMPFEHADNDYLEMLFDLGILAVAFPIFLISVCRKASNDLAPVAVIGCILADALTSSPLHNPATALVAAISLGAIAGRGVLLQRAGLRSSEARPGDLGRHGHLWAPDHIRPLAQCFSDGQADTADRRGLSGKLQSLRS